MWKVGFSKKRNKWCEKGTEFFLQLSLTKLRLLIAEEIFGRALSPICGVRLDGFPANGGILQFILSHLRTKMKRGTHQYMYRLDRNSEISWFSQVRLNVYERKLALYIYKKDMHPKAWNLVLTHRNSNKYRPWKSSKNW